MLFYNKDKKSILVDNDNSAHGALDGSDFIDAKFRSSFSMSQRDEKPSLVTRRE
jgi:hypothetical protein